MSEDAPELTAELVVDGAVPSLRWAAGQSAVVARFGWPLPTVAHRRGS